jgi:hypothetical protein
VLCAHSIVSVVIRGHDLGGHKLWGQGCMYSVQYLPSLHKVSTLPRYLGRLAMSTNAGLLQGSTHVQLPKTIVGVRVDYQAN